jgi:hypothetical protein
MRGQVVFEITRMLVPSAASSQIERETNFHRPAIFQASLESIELAFTAVRLFSCNGFV